ncbi:MAG: penicillin acylase family protein [Chloroflexota bacterium]|nr:penicillin acylase family protein [Chloroflexota bacterium]
MTPGYSIALVALIIVTVGLLLFLGMIWYIFLRPLARTEGEQTVAGLRQAVEVVRDRWGIPHIYAQNEQDAYQAQGYVHAQDRFFQMEYARRLSRGTLSEVFGSATLAADRWCRIVGLERSAALDLAMLGEAELANLTAYAAGVNAFIEQNRLRLPAEFSILGHKPGPWTPLDTIGIVKVLGWALSHNWQGEILRLQLLDLLGPGRAAELEALYPETSPDILPTYGEIEGQAVAETAGRVRLAYDSAAQWFGGSGQAASNNWVLSPDRTATRRPLLANDPHLHVSMPAIWYQSHLVAEDGSLAVSGAGIPGVPGILIGHNEQIGWGITAGVADTQDLYVERRDTEDPSRFLSADGWRRAQVLREEIGIRDQDEAHVEEVLITDHGPLIDGLLPDEQRARLPSLALRWSGHEPATSFKGLFLLQKAGNWSEFRAALAHVADLSLNVLYADVAGNIGYQYVARVPKRKGGFGLLPSPGWASDNDWDGWIAFEELPHALNPTEGQLLSANNKPASDAYSFFLGEDWSPGYRATRIKRMLEVKPRYTVQDFQRMQMDVYSVQAEALVPFMIMVNGSTQLEQRIVRELETWNLHVEVDSFGAAAYQVMRLHLAGLVFGDKLAGLETYYEGMTFSDVFKASSFAGKAGQCLVALLDQEKSWWFGDAATGQTRNRQELLQLALKQTATTLRDLIGKDPRKWAWGKVHQVEFAHILGRRRLLSAIFNRGQYPVGGDGHTVWMTGSDMQLPFGLVNATANYRQVLDVGDWDRSTAVLCTGQSGQPGSAHYADLIDMWREGDQHPMLWSRDAVDREADVSLWLKPVEEFSGMSNE